MGDMISKLSHVAYGFADSSGLRESSAVLSWPQVTTEY